MASVERVAFLGMGIMGSRMAASLARAGFELTVWNRTPKRAEEVAGVHGMPVAATPAEAAASADAVITGRRLPPGGGSAVRSRRCGRGARARSAASAFSTHRLGLYAEGRGRHADIMVGAEPDAYRRALPLFEAMGEPLFRLGHMLKDVRLALATAAELALEPRVARAVERLYAEAEAGGRGEHDFAAVIEPVERSRTDGTAGS